jgi:hypothetical protein
LLHAGADSPRLTGSLVSGRPGEEPFSTLRYEVVRVWQIPVEQLLRGGIGTLALAPISDVSEGEVRGVVRRMRQRLAQARERKAGEILAASYILLGVRYPEEFANAIFEEVLGMEESVTYQAIIRKGAAMGEARGRAAEARRVLLRLGEKRFGRPAASVKAAVEAITDVERLEALIDQLLDAQSWQELLPPAPGPRRKRSR